MTLNQIQYYCTVCKYGNYTKAAEELHVSQPAVSKAVRELESECGVPLIVRRGNSLVVTEKGKILWDELSYILQCMERLDYIIKELSMERRFVRVGISTFSGNHVFPKIRRQFHINYPEIEVFSQEDVTDSLFAMLDSRAADVIITGPWRYFDEHGSSDYDYYRLGTFESFLFCVSKDHPLAKKDEVTLEEMAAEPLVMLNDKYSPTKSTKRMFAENGLVPNIIHYTSQMYTVERFVEQGAAAGFLPGDVARENPKIVGIKFKKYDKGSVALVWRKEDVMYDSVKKFIATAKSLYSNKNRKNM